MIRLVYVSELAQDTSAQAVDEIVRLSAERNAAKGITGVLALEERRICQVLEGEDLAVAELFETIAKDPRHRSVVELDRTAVSVRRFERWAMIRRPMIDIVVLALQS